MHRKLVLTGLLASAAFVPCTWVTAATPAATAAKPPDRAEARPLRRVPAQAMPYFSFAGVLRQRNG